MVCNTTVPGEGAGAGLMKKPGSPTGGAAYAIRNVPKKTELLTRVRIITDNKALIKARHLLLKEHEVLSLGLS
ncbi:MAG: hypothetical protein AMXMBFR84_12600 [Candidatus Hydrogenedentota bacterium]